MCQIPVGPSASVTAWGHGKFAGTLKLVIEPTVDPLSQAAEPWVASGDRPCHLKVVLQVPLWPPSG